MTSDMFVLPSRLALDDSQFNRIHVRSYEQAEFNFLKCFSSLDVNLLFFGSWLISYTAGEALRSRKDELACVYRKARWLKVKT